MVKEGEHRVQLGHVGRGPSASSRLPRSLGRFDNRRRVRHSYDILQGRARARNDDPAGRYILVVEIGVGVFELDDQLVQLVGQKRVQIP